MREGQRGAWRAGGLVGCALVLSASSAAGVHARRDRGAPVVCVEHRVDSLAVRSCDVSLGNHAIRLYLRDRGGQPIGSFARLDSAVRSEHHTLLLGGNAGMFDGDHLPVGLYVANNTEVAALNLRDVAGDPVPNFYLKPNGVFAIIGGRAVVLEAHAFDSLHVTPQMATQSGPLLVRHGVVHPALRPDGTSRYIRNGVGVRRDGTVVFAISESPIGFYPFATFFRDSLHCPDALYLDGAISAMYVAPGPLDTTIRFGPMFAVTE